MIINEIMNHNPVEAPTPEELELPMTPGASDRMEDLLDRPLSYREWLALPSEIACDYIEGLMDRYGVTGADIAAMMGVKRGTLRATCARRGVINRNNAGPSVYVDVSGWKRFCSSRAIQTPPTHDNAPRLILGPEGVSARVEDLEGAVSFLERIIEMSGAGPYIVKLIPTE